jgi:hypothetical protein
MAGYSTILRGTAQTDSGALRRLPFGVSLRQTAPPRQPLQLLPACRTHAVAQDMPRAASWRAAAGGRFRVTRLQLDMGIMDVYNSASFP